VVVSKQRKEFLVAKLYTVVVDEEELDILMNGVQEVEGAAAFNDEEDLAEAAGLLYDKLCSIPEGES
jgi:hypothetical protein